MLKVHQLHLTDASKVFTVKKNGTASERSWRDRESSCGSVSVARLSSSSEEKAYDCPTLAYGPVLSVWL